VVDNGSNDRTLDVAISYSEAYPNFIKYVIEDSIQSSYAARNKGIDLASGDIIAFTDSDCIADSEWLSGGILCLKKLNTSVVAGEIRFTYLRNNPSFWEYFDSARKLNQRSYVENSGFGATANLFVKREIFRKHGVFLDTLISGGDYEFGRRITDQNETIAFCRTAVIFHKARTNFYSILLKSSRVATGQKALEKMGLLHHGLVTWKSLLPAKSAPNIEGYRIGFIKKIGYIFFRTFFSYYNFFKRL